jgi:hypothetical protein
VGISGEEEGGEGLRRAVKFTADEEGCIRAKGEPEDLSVFPKDDRLSWGAVNHPLNSGRDESARQGEGGLWGREETGGRIEMEVGLVARVVWRSRVTEWCRIVMVWSEKSLGGRKEEKKGREVTKRPRCNNLRRKA